MQGKVEICGVNTSRLRTLDAETTRALLEKAKWANFNCIRVDAGKRGFRTTGAIVGWGQNVPDDVTADNIPEKGGMFIPFAGWIAEGGYLDRTWLLTLWGSTSHNDTMAGLYLSTFIDYCDHWGWGDGKKRHATAIRCIKK